MVCPNCESKIALGSEFCPNCGANLPVTQSKNIQNKKTCTNKKQVAILSGIVVAICIAVFIVLAVLRLASSTKGERVASSLADNLGRSFAVAEKNSEMPLSQKSEHAVLTDIMEYSYIAESEKTIKVEGINVPEWVVFVNIDENDKLAKVTYCNLKILENDWRGEKSTGTIDTSTVAYGMTKTLALKEMKIKPLSVIYSNDDITSYVYKYYFTDELTHNDRSYYMTIKFNLDNKVNSTPENKENKYAKYIFSGE